MDTIDYNLTSSQPESCWDLRRVAGKCIPVHPEGISEAGSTYPRRGANPNQTWLLTTRTLERARSTANGVSCTFDLPVDLKSSRILQEVKDNSTRSHSYKYHQDKCIDY